MGSGSPSAARARSQLALEVGREQQYQSKRHFEHCQKKKEKLAPYGPGKIKNKGMNAALITLFYDNWSTMTSSKQDKHAAITKTREALGIRTHRVAKRIIDHYLDTGRIPADKPRRRSKAKYPFAHGHGQITVEMLDWVDKRMEFERKRVDMNPTQLAGILQILRLTFEVDIEPWPLRRHPG